MDHEDPDYQRKTGAHLISRAKQWGWDPTEGEGAFEFMTRCVYERAIEDLVDGHYMAISHKTRYLLTKKNQEE
jgi:hypothetical protein